MEALPLQSQEALNHCLIERSPAHSRREFASQCKLTCNDISRSPKSGNPRALSPLSTRQGGLLQASAQEVGMHSTSKPNVFTLISLPTAWALPVLGIRAADQEHKS